MPRKVVFGPVATAIAIVCGAVLWAIEFACLGAITHRAGSGALGGAAIGAIIGYGYAKNVIGRVVVWVSVFAALGAVVGPGSDADACTSAVAGAVIGAILGWFGWTGVFMLLFAYLGAIVGGIAAEGIGATVGIVLGPALAWLAMNLDRKSAVVLEGDDRSFYPQSEASVDQEDL
jgi:hypothetical protein